MSIACSRCSDSTAGRKIPPPPHFPVVQLNSLPTYRRVLLSERLEQANMSAITSSYLNSLFSLSDFLPYIYSFILVSYLLQFYHVLLLFPIAFSLLTVIFFLETIILLLSTNSRIALLIVGKIIVLNYLKTEKTDDVVVVVAGRKSVHLQCTRELTVHAHIIIIK